MAAETPGAENGSATLPQLDPTWFPSQIFWLAIFFGLLYWLLSNALLPKVQGAIEQRRAKLRSDIDAAAKANEEARAAFEIYEATLAESRRNARAALDAAREEAELRRAELTVAAEAKLALALEAAQARAAGVRAEGMAAAQEAAADTAQAIVEKILGAPTASQRVPATVGDAA